MKKIIASIFAFAAVLSLNAATVSGDGKAELSSALSIVNSGFTPTGSNVTAGELDFGNIAIGTVDTKFTINAATGAMTQDEEIGDGGAKATGGTPNAAAFKVTGTEGQTFDVALGDPTATSAQGTSLTLTKSYDPNLASGGNQVNVGGELTVPSAAIPGSVAYTFDVVVNYN